MSLDLAAAIRGLPVGGSTPGGPVRLTPAAADKLPVDTVRAGEVRAGVRLEVRGTASGLRLSTRTYPGVRPCAPTTRAAFSVWCADRCCAQVPFDPDGSEVDIPLPARDADATVTVYLPDPVPVELLSAVALGGDLDPAPELPRWLAYGDSITQGWSVQDPGSAWPAVAGRAAGLDVVNLGFAGSARGELPAAAMLAEQPADLISLAWGTNCWSSIPVDADLIAATMRVFVTTVRQGHPEVPLLVLSPILRPAAESVPNRYGATLAELRTAVETTIRRLAEHDDRLVLLPGRDLVGPEHLVDGIHPGDEGHRLMAAAVAGTLRRHFS